MLSLISKASSIHSSVRSTVLSKLTIGARLGNKIVLSYCNHPLQKMQKFALTDDACLCRYAEVSQHSKIEKIWCYSPSKTFLYKEKFS